MITENLSTLKINKLTRAQYEAALEAGRINENELYMTLEEGTDAPATIGYVDEAIINNSNTFIAIYGETTTAELEEAYAAGKAIFCYNGMIMFAMYGRMSLGGYYHYFYCVNVNGNVTTCQCYNDTWSTIFEGEVPPLAEGKNYMLVSNITGGWTPTDVETVKTELGVDKLTKDWGTITIPVSGWSSTQTDGWYTNQVAVTDMTADYNPYADVVYTSSATVSDEDGAFGCIKEIETGAGIIIAKAIELPTIDVKIRLMGV